MDIQYYKDNQKTRFFAEQYEQLLNRKADSLKMSETEEDPSMKEMALQESVELQDQADQMKKQMDEILEEEKAEDDFPNEIILEVLEKDAEKISKEMKEIMENVYKLKVPLVVDTKTGLNWGEL
jgi:DNA polymerase I-like protein with 3'-5' exonuclease and polymerase domains